MFKLRNVLIIGLMSFMLVGCVGEKVEVPPAAVGKIMGKDGYRQGTVPTSKFRLDWCVRFCDSLVTMSVADFSINETMDLFMPQDRLVMDFDLRLTLTPKAEQYDSLFDRIPPIGGQGVQVIPMESVYVTYAQQIIRSEAREILSKYTIAEVASSREAVNIELTTALTETINERTPFMVRYLGIADIGYPEVITTAQIKAAERREAIQQEEAQLEISKVSLERQLQEARLQRAIDVEAAQAESDVNLILADSVTEEYITYKQLEALQKISVSDNVVYMPIEMLSSMAAQVKLGNN